MQQRSEEWFEARKGRLTGSNVGAALGLNPWKDHRDLVREMVREYHGAEREFKGNVATEYGTMHEPGATVEYELETGNKVQECGFFALGDFWGASPDGLIGDDGLIEIKCPYGQRDKNPPQFKSIYEQPHYYAQIQMELKCTGRKWCHFYQWSMHGTNLETVYFDPDFFREHEYALEDFRSFYEQELKNPDHLKPKRKQIESAKASQLVEEYNDLQDAIDHATARKKEVMAELVELAGEQNADICGKKLTKVEKQGSVSYAKVVKDHLPKLDLEPYRGKPTEYWMLK